MRVLVAGAGFAGSVVARELADAGHRVLVVDRRDHIGGNAYDTTDAHGVLVHRYGPHIFHTNSAKVHGWLSRFTAWRPYEHRVLARLDGALYPVPVNLTTINSLYGLQLDEAGVAAHLERVREVRTDARGRPVRETSEDVVLSAVGRDLCERFFRGYTRKQWGLDLSELGPSVAARIPVRTGTDDRYFTDTYQAMPAEGYTRMFERMLDHPGIEVRTGCDHREAVRGWPHDHLVFTGPVDEFFDHRLGRLPYRSLRFEHLHLPDVQRYQPVGTVNYPQQDVAWTRITEFRHLTGQHHRGTSLVREFPTEGADPYYPVPRPENQRLYRRYQELAQAQPRTSFVGRLAEYRYLNMDQVVASALALGARLIPSAQPAETVP